MSTLKFVIIESSFDTLNFGICFAFPKVPGSSLSEGPIPGPGPLYKV